MNPEKLSNIFWDLAFNTAYSFNNNTNWQAYSGGSSLSYLTQMIGFTLQNFLSAAVGICVLMVLIRGFIKTKTKNLGNFGVDLTKSILYILLPLSIVLAMFLTTQGVVQSLRPFRKNRAYIQIIGGIIIIRFIMLIPYISFIAWILSVLFVMGFVSIKYICNLGKNKIAT